LAFSARIENEVLVQGMDQAASPPHLNTSTATALSLALAGCAVTMIGVWFGFAPILLAIFAVGVFLALRKAGPVGQVALLMLAIQLNIFSIEFGDRYIHSRIFLPCVRLPLSRRPCWCCFYGGY
jgi:hypothetical protein